MEKPDVDAKPNGTVRLSSALSRLSLHGAPEIAEAGAPLQRCFWLLAVGASAVAVCVGVYSSFQDWFNSPILTSYAIKSQPINFPDVYFCPMSPIDRRRQPPEFDIQQVAVKYLQPMVDSPTSTNKVLAMMTRKWDQVDMLNSSSADYFADSSVYLMLPHMLSNYFETVSFNVTDFVRECRFGLKDVVCTSVVEKLFDKDYGVCYLARVNASQMNAGAGLQVVLDLHSNDRVKAPVLNGVAVHVSHRFDPTVTTSNYIVASAGTLTKIRLDATKLQLINFENSRVRQKCHEGTQGDFRHLHNLQYSRSGCRVDCVLRTLFAVCGCLPLLQERYTRTDDNHIRRCRYSELGAECPIGPRIVENERTISNCTQRCLPPCTSWRFRHSVSAIHINALDVHLNDVGSNFGKAADLIIVDIALSNIQYEEIRQSASMTAATLLSNVGGQLGLWLGASLLSLVQLVAVIAVLCANARRSATIDAQRTADITSRQSSDNV